MTRTSYRKRALFGLTVPEGWGCDGDVVEVQQQAGTVTDAEN